MTPAISIPGPPTSWLEPLLETPVSGVDRAAALEASLAIAADRAGDLTPLVYARLFAAQPAMEAEFWRDRSGAIRGEMLARVFEVLLDLAGPRAYADQLIGTEYITHDSYGIPRPVFGTFFRTVADTVRAVAGPDWSPAMDAAWAALLAEVDAILAAIAEPDAASGLPGQNSDAALPSS